MLPKKIQISQIEFFTVEFKAVSFSLPNCSLLKSKEVDMHMQRNPAEVWDFKGLLSNYNEYLNFIAHIFINVP